MLINVQCQVWEKERLRLRLQFLSLSSPCDSIRSPLNGGQRGDVSWFGLGMACGNYGERRTSEGRASDGASCHISLSPGELDLLATVESLAWQLESKILQLSKRNGNLKRRRTFFPSPVQSLCTGGYSWAAKMLNNRVYCTLVVVEFLHLPSEFWPFLLLWSPSAVLCSQEDKLLFFFFSHLKLRICFQGFNMKRNYSDIPGKTEPFSNI